MSSITDDQINAVIPLRAISTSGKRKVGRVSLSEHRLQGEDSFQIAGSNEKGSTKGRGQERHSGDVTNPTVSIKPCIDGKGANLHGGSSRDRRSSTPREVKARDGRVYCLPTCVTVRDDRLVLVNTIKIHSIDGERMYARDSWTGRSSVQKQIIPSCAITRENLLALRCVCHVCAIAPFSQQ